eukprot:gene3695-4043_t
MSNKKEEGGDGHATVLADIEGKEESEDTQISKAGASGLLQVPAATGGAQEQDKEGLKSTYPASAQILTKKIEEVSQQIENQEESLIFDGKGISQQLHVALLGVNYETLQLASLLQGFEDRAERFCVPKCCLPVDGKGPSAEEPKADKEEEKLLTLNVGGTKITISYDLILNAGRQCGLLGVLLHPRWRSLMVRDREGNIFLDLDAEWLQPILDSMQSNQLNRKPSFFDHLILPSLPAVQEGFWTLRDFFRMGLSRVSNGLSALETIMTSKQASELWNYIQMNNKKAAIRYVKEVKTPISAMPSISSGLKHLLIGIGSSRWIGFITDQALWESNPTQVLWLLCEGNNSPVRAFVGPVKVSSPFDYYSYNIYHSSLEISSNPATSNINGNYYSQGTNTNKYPIEKWVVYEICQNDQQTALDVGNRNDHFDFEPEVEMFQSVDFNITVSPVVATNSRSTVIKSLPSIDKYINQCVSRLNRLSSLSKIIEQMQQAVANNRSKVLDEILFMENYVLSVYGLPAVQRPNKDELRQGGVGLHQIADSLKRLEELLPAVCAQNQANLSVRTDISSIHQSLVAYFNVAGSQICANRKTLLQAFPNSQLATRMSDRWEEQADTLDREGNMIYNLPSGVFKAIINAARISTLNHSPPKVRVSPTQVQQVKAVIDYLMISDLSIEIIN